MPGTGEASVARKWPRGETLVLSKGGAFREADLDSVLNFTPWTSKSSSLQQVTISSILSTGDKGPFYLFMLIVRLKINFIKHLMFGLAHRKCSVNHAYINRSCLTLQLRDILSSTAPTSLRENHDIQGQRKMFLKKILRSATAPNNSTNKEICFLS